MSGEGTIPICAPATECHGAVPVFDQRPGVFEATRIDADSGIMVTGSRGTARRGNWQVLCTASGEDGTFCQVPLTPERARELARELIDMADVLEGRIW